MSEPLRLFGLKAIVTSATSGIGEAIVRTFVKQGADVLAVDAPATGIDTHFRRLSGVNTLALDLDGDGAPAALIDAARSTLGALDIVVNNFDWHTDTPIADAAGEQMQALLQRMTRLLSGICDLSLPLLQKSPAGRIINIGCLRSVFARDGEAAYRESQRALAELTAAVAARSGEFGITANYIQPGAVMTPVSRRVFSADKELRDHCIRQSAARRLGEPVDIAKVALFLATDDAVFVSGTGVIADGGVRAA